MMRWWQILGVLILFSITSLSPAGAQQPPEQVPVDVVPYVRLIANPGAFDGKTVYVSGFLRIEFEGNALFLNLEQLDYGVYEDAIMLDLGRARSNELKRFHRKHVTLVGVFRAKTRGHLYSPIAGFLESTEFVRENKKR